MDEFLGRTAVVTGAAQGIGRAVAEHLAERGARIVAVDLRDSHSESLPGQGHLGIDRDLTETDAADQVVRQALEVTGGIDILVNSAGVALLARAAELSQQDWDASVAINLTTSFRMAQATGRHMIARGYGRIVNLASQASVVALDKHAAYAATKAGIVGVTNVLALEWAPYGVTVNAVSPTVVETELGKRAWAGEVGEKMRALIPTGRFAQPAEVAALIGYLLGEDAAMITGENIRIDGGYSIA